MIGVNALLHNENIDPKGGSAGSPRGHAPVWETYTIPVVARSRRAARSLSAHFNGAEVFDPDLL
jgi:hypothetical protein